MARDSDEEFQRLHKRLGETYFISDIMVPKDDLKYVRKDQSEEAKRYIQEFRFSAVPTRPDKKDWFDGVYLPETHPGDQNLAVNWRRLDVPDFLPERTPLIEAVRLFDKREWYLTLKGTSASGIVTYTDFEKRPFGLLCFSLLGRFEELARDLLAADGCGRDNEPGGLQKLLTVKSFEKAMSQFKKAYENSSQNRFVDYLDFYAVEDALMKHEPWKNFPKQKFLVRSKNDYEQKTFNEFRDIIAHNRNPASDLETFRDSLHRLVDLESAIFDLESYLRGKSQ